MTKISPAQVVCFVCRKVAAAVVVKDNGHKVYPCCKACLACYPAAARPNVLR
jgi:hypothetical protein